MQNSSSRKLLFLCLAAVILLAGGGKLAAAGGGPTVVEHTPRHGETQVPLDGTIKVTWSQPMIQDTDFVVIGPDGRIDGTFSYDREDYSVTFTPEIDLTLATRYRVVVAGQVDAGGRLQESPVQFEFETLEPTSVAVAEFSATPSLQQNWWWTLWPWLMLLISSVSLLGFLSVVKRRAS